MQCLVAINLQSARPLLVAAPALSSSSAWRRCSITHHRRAWRGELLAKLGRQGEARAEFERAVLSRATNGSGNRCSRARLVQWRNDFRSFHCIP
jgi:predicted RNA polymerase sigma factor